MNKKEKELAIKLFKDQLDSLMKITFDQQEVWANQTMDLIRQYISPTSQHLKSFGVFEPIMGEYLLPENRKIGKDIIENCLKTLENKITYEPIKQNYFSKLTDTWITTILLFLTLTVGGASYSIGYELGNKQHDYETLKIKQENDSLKVVLSSSKILPLPDFDTNKQMNPSIKNSEQDSLNRIKMTKD